MINQLANHRIIYFLILMPVYLLIIIQVSCQADKTAEKKGGTVVIGMRGDFDSFNELNASDSDALQVINNMLFMRLTRLDENFEIVPHLARSWEFSENHTILTYHLRDDVTWTDGNGTTAEDVLFTFEMAVHPKVAYPAASRFDLTERVEVIDPYTIRFYFKKAYPDALFDTQIPILPKHIFKDIPPEKISQSAFNRNPIGNGPFRMVEWMANRHVIFEFNAQFALGRPPIDRVIFSIIPDESVLATNLITATIDIAPSLSSQDYKRIQTIESLQGLRYDGRGYTFIAWNQARSLFTKGVCRALTHAIDKNEIIATLLEGFGKSAKGPLLPFVWAYDENLEDLQFDPTLSGSMLKDEGWEDTDGDGFLDRGNKKFEFTIKTNTGSQLRKDVAVMIQAQLKNIGIKANVQIVEFNLLLDQVFGDKDFDAFVSTWEADFTVNPTDLFHSKAILNGYNFVSYRNPKIDTLLEKGRAISNQRKAKACWDEFQKIIIEDCPYTFLFITDKLAGFNKKVEGVKMDARGFLTNIWEWQIHQGE